MALIPPNSWSELRHPEQRYEVLLTFEEIVSSANCTAASESFDIDAVYHTLFDDTDLGSDAASEVGYTLLDEAERQVVHSVCQALDDMLRELGDVETSKYLNHPKWGEVQERARMALLVMSRAGTAVLT